MLRKILGAAVAATAVTAAVATVVMKKNKKETEEYDEPIHFINIDDDEGEEKVVEEISEEVKEIATIYPYLSTEFIAEQFARNAAFNEQYPEDTLVIMSHKARFSHEEEKLQFVDIASQNGYEVKEVNSKEIIATKKLYTTDGAILSDIYNVANQVNCLNGTYEGYNID
jgi:peptidyl-tRNA hydrolase